MTEPRTVGRNLGVRFVAEVYTPTGKGPERQWVRALRGYKTQERAERIARAIARGKPWRVLRIEDRIVARGHGS